MLSFTMYISRCAAPYPWTFSYRSHIRDQTQGEAWFKPAEERVATGVCLRTETGQFRVFPYNNALLVPFEAAVRLLNPVVAVKLRSAAVHAAFATM